MSDGPEWFAPKRYGYGSSLPISWQGWAVTGAYVVVAAGIAFALKDQPFQLVAAMIPPTVAFCVVCARTTRGGWRWRWGDED